MADRFLHEHPDFASLIRIVSDERGIVETLVEKDYWIMHVLFGLQQQGYEFELKGGTSLSKGFGLIHRFSEDIDIYIAPPAILKINENPKNIKPAHVKKRGAYYEQLSAEIKVPGIYEIGRDTDFDDQAFRSGGIRLYYPTHSPSIEGVKEGILLEVGFANVKPNRPITISSWALDYSLALGVTGIIDSRAIDVRCYHPGYTLVEKLQTIITKFRKEITSGDRSVNFMRQYYDVYCLLGDEEVQRFIVTDEYLTHKSRHFSTADKEIPISQNDAFILADPSVKADFRKRYQSTKSLYYNGQPDFDNLLTRLRQFINEL